MNNIHAARPIKVKKKKKKKKVDHSETVNTWQ